LKVYWDSSAAINAIVSKSVWSRLSADEHFTRSHLFSEVFAIMTGRGIVALDQHGNPGRLVMTSNDAAAWLAGFASHVKLVELDGPELLAALGNAQSQNVVGARVYDYIHALAADKAGADVLLTRNTKDFQSAGGAARVEWP
jgi:hypothetical protein